MSQNVDSRLKIVVDDWLLSLTARSQKRSSCRSWLVVCFELSVVCFVRSLFLSFVCLRVFCRSIPNLIEKGRNLKKFSHLLLIRPRAHAHCDIKWKSIKFTQATQKNLLNASIVDLSK